MDAYPPEIIGLDLVTLNWYTHLMSEERLILYEGPAFTVEWSYDERGRSPADETKFRNEGDKIFAFKPQPERFLCFFFTGRKVIITNGFHKKSQKLPLGEKEKALQAKRDYEQRVKERIYYEAFTKI